jgi:DNA-binding response OmpR family regulator
MCSLTTPIAETFVTNYIEHPTIFIIDDDLTICRVAERALKELGIETKAFHTAKAAFAALEDGHPPVILLDVALSGSDAVDVIHGLSARRYSGIIHVMSGAERIGMREGLAFGAPLYKPFRVSQLTALGNSILTPLVSR